MPKDKMAKPNNKNLIGSWILSLLLVAIIFFIGMDVAPYLHGDEFMIIDLGRIIIHPESGWSITWIVERNEPAFVFFYIGPVMNELIYLLFGEFGTRIGGIVGALFGATVMLGWLISRKTPPYIAFGLCLIFLLDPIFVQSYTLGRLDGWAIAFSLLSCWLLRITANNVITGRFALQQQKLIVLAGILSITALFIWPSSFILFPLIISELLNLNINKNRMKNSNMGKRSSVLLVFGASCFLGTAILFLPIVIIFYNSFANIFEGLLINLTQVSPNENGSILLTGITPFLEVLRGLKFTPVLFILSIISLLFTRDKLLIGGTLSAILIICFTVVYIHRIQYLLPYLIAIVSTIFSNNPVVQKRFGKIIFLNLKRYAVTLLFAWVILISLIARTILVFHKSEGRDRNLVFLAAEEMIGGGSHKVFLGPPEFYLSGRSLGWKMYRRYAPIGDALTPESIQPVLSNLDHVILEEWEVTEEFDSILCQNGFSKVQLHSLYNRQTPKSNGKTTNIQRLRNLFSIFENPYGPYKLYSKEGFSSHL